jgi:hypothetical protein
VVNGAYDRAAIMIAAIAEAKVERARGSSLVRPYGIGAPVRLGSRQGAADRREGMMEPFVYLAAARHNRLCALACPDEAETYKERCRYWIARARKSTGPPLP